MKQISLLSGVKFELRKKDSNEVVHIDETDENGEIIFSELRKGNYTLKEIETVPEYKINDTPFDITIECGVQSEIKVTNDIIKGWLRIIKQDLEHSSVRLNGVQFELYDEDMNLLETLETDERGEAMSGLYPSVNRKYYLKEIKSAEGYVLDSGLKEVTLLNDQMRDIFIKNAREPKEPIIIEKTPDPETIIIEKDPEIIYIEKEPEKIYVEKEAKVIIEEIEPEPIIKKVIIGEPKIVEEVIKLPKTGM